MDHRKLKAVEAFVLILSCGTGDVGRVDQERAFLTEGETKPKSVSAKGPQAKEFGVAVTGAAFRMRPQRNGVRFKLKSLQC